MSKKILLVDGCSILATCFFGNSPLAYKAAKTKEERAAKVDLLLKTTDGIYTNGIFSFCKMLDRVQKNSEFSHIAIAWDESRNTFRRELYSEYKAQRDETSLELKSQIERMQQLLKYIGVPSISLTNYEGDDIIGSLATKFKTEMEVVIWTKDQDQLQLIGDNVSVWLVTSKTDDLCKKYGNHGVSYLNNVFKYNCDRFKAEYEMEPAQLVDYKALCGDSSDNIPGVPKIGDKSAKAFISEFGTVENLVEYVENATDEMLSEKKKQMKATGKTASFEPLKLKENRELAILCKKLTTIVCDLSMPDSKELLFAPNSTRKENIYKRLEFFSLL